MFELLIFINKLLRAPLLVYKLFSSAAVNLRVDFANYSHVQFMAVNQAMDWIEYLPKHSTLAIAKNVKPLVRQHAERGVLNLISLEERPGLDVIVNPPHISVLRFFREGWEVRSYGTLLGRDIIKRSYGGIIKSGHFLERDIKFYGDTHKDSKFYIEFRRKVKYYTRNG